ncbi:MAG: glycerate kinase [Anaerolineales bacterium]|nr:glycerate kinase [Anaerolineales bacterium]
MDAYLTRTLRRMPWGSGVARILASAVEAVEPRKAVQRAMRIDGDSLLIEGTAYPLQGEGQIYVVGAGKAGAPMAQGAVEILGDSVRGGVVIVKEGHYTVAGLPSHLEIIPAGHPVPDRRGVEGTRRLAAMISDLSPQDLVICLISGGGSALLTLPAEGIAREDIQELTRLLLASGAGIEEINTLRRHLDLVKGGGLARLAAPARVATLILSDVIGNPLEAIASGPTAPDRTTYADALEILGRYDLLQVVPAGILARLKAGSAGGLEENPGREDPVFKAVQNVLIGSNRLAADAAIRQARQEGYQTLLLTTSLQGEAKEAGRLLASLARGMVEEGVPLSRPALLVAGGETTVRVQGEGLGGRNSEMALGAVRDMSGLPGAALVTLATDGGDGPTDAAGAVVTGETLAQAKALGLEPEVYLKRNDSYNFFAPLGDLLKPGPTLTNVNDLAFVFTLGTA